MFRDELPKWKSTHDVEKSLEDHCDACFDKCLGKSFFGPMRESIELVFSDQVSPGHICGVKEAVKNSGQKIPGTCCLDAPYQLEGNDWGFKAWSDLLCGF